MLWVLLLVKVRIQIFDFSSSPIQGATIRLSPGLVNFVSAVAYLFCLNLPAVFSQPGNGLTKIPCNHYYRGTPYFFFLSPPLFATFVMDCVKVCVSPFNDITRELGIGLLLPSRNHVKVIFDLSNQ